MCELRDEYDQYWGLRDQFSLNERALMDALGGLPQPPTTSGELLAVLTNARAYAEFLHPAGFTTTEEESNES